MAEKGNSLRLVLPRLHDAQRKIVSQSRRFNVCCLGRRTGKTVLGMDVLIDGPRQKGALHGYPVAWYAPNYKLLSEVWRKLVRTLAPVTKAKNEQEKRIELITGGVVEMWSLDDADAGRGRKYATVVIDEAAMIRNLDDAWQNNIRPLLSDYSGEAWVLSTPKGDNFFRELYERGNPANPARETDFVSFQMPTWVNPYIAAEEIEAMRRDLPRLSFMQEIEAQFVNFGGTFVKPDMIRTGQAPQGMALYQGVDLAISMRDTADYTAVVTVGIDEDGRVWIVDAERRRCGFHEALDFIKHKAHRWNPVTIAIEAVQYQAAVVETLLRTTDLPVMQVRPDKDKLTRAYSLIARYESGLVWHDDRVPRYFTEEVLSFGPDCEHDDLVDAAVYAYLTAGEYGRSKIFIERVEPDPVVETPVAIVRQTYSPDTCADCSSFRGGRCADRGFLVKETEPACSFFVAAS